MMLGPSSSSPPSWRNPPQSEITDQQQQEQHQNQKQREEHPMIPVPQALRTVLQQTASNIIQQRSTNINNGNVSSSHCEVLSLSNPTTVFGRISSETLYAPEPGYPPYHASIMDGYAINTNDIQNANFLSDNSTIKRFQIVNRVHAGNTKTAVTETAAVTDSSVLQNDHLPKAIYVTTGAAIPYPTYNTVIPIELVNEYNVSNQVIAIDRKVLIDAQPDKWIRKIGCDIPSKEVIVQSGTSIEAVHIGLLLQCGYTEIKVQPLPTVGILSTGNEIMSIDEMKKQEYYQTGYHNNHIGMIPDANGPVLSSLLTSYQNCNIKNYGIVNDDDIDILTSTLSKAIQECNVIITSGGVSKGEKDIIEHVLCEKLDCQIHFGRLHMKPGKPTTFGTCEKLTEDGAEDKCFIFAMPGNPVSAFVCTELLVRPCLDMLHSTVVVDNNNTIPIPTTMMNVEGESKEVEEEKEVKAEMDRSENVLTMVQNASVHTEIHATLTNRVKLDVERPEYLRVKLSTRVVFDQNGYESFLFEATSTGVQRSSRLMSMCDADGLMMLPQGIQGAKLFAEEGESYPVLLLRRPGGASIKDGFMNTIKLKDSLHYQTSSLTVGIVNIIGNNASFHENDDVLDENMSTKIGDEYTDDVQSRIMYALDDESIFFLQNLKVSDSDSISNVIRSKMSNCLDIIFVVCSQTSFQMNLEVSNELRRFITKDAQALSLQARRNAAHSQPLAALFDPVAGYCDIDGKSCLLLSLSEDGLENALYSVRNLLKRAVSIVGGKQVIY